VNHVLLRIWSPRARATLSPPISKDGLEVLVRSWSGCKSITLKHFAQYRSCT
jgi:hypothetical protein